MTNLCRGLLVQAVLLLCFGLVHTFECKQRCKIGIDSCPTGKTCILQKDNSERCEEIRFSNCFDVLHEGGITEDGVYYIRTWNTQRIIQVFCDMNTAEGGWTVFQNRFDGSVDFYRNFAEYENGFGNIKNEFWLGLENLYELVAQGTSELRIDISTANGSRGYETFQDFTISPAPSYTISIALGTGTIGDSPDDGMSFNNGSAFSTFDRDMDGSSGNCALGNNGGWWYKNCMNVHLNGKYCTPGTDCSYKGMMYRRFSGFESLLTSRMMFRRV